MKQNIRTQRLWVVFTDQTDLWWLKILRPGFRHCFVVLHDGQRWITVDPLSHRMEIKIQDVPEGFDLPRWLKDQGNIVLRVRQQVEPEERAAPIMPFSCVETVKRIIGIRARSVITPWQLYRYLQRPEGASIYERGILSWEV